MKTKQMNQNGPVRGATWAAAVLAISSLGLAAPNQPGPPRDAPPTGERPQRDRVRQQRRDQLPPCDPADCDALQVQRRDRLGRSDAAPPDGFRQRSRDRGDRGDRNTPRAMRDGRGGRTPSADHAGAPRRAERRGLLAQVDVSRQRERVRDRSEARPGAPRRGPGGGPPPLWSRLSEEERGEVQAFMLEHFPRMYEEMERLQERNPERYQHRMMRLAPEMRGLMDQMAINPERGGLMIEERRLDLEIRMLSGRVRRADNPDLERVRERMHDLCTRQFDVRHRRREMEIHELEARIGELRQRHAEAARMRDQIIEKAVNDRMEFDEPFPEPPDGPRRGEPPMPEPPNDHLPEDETPEP